MLFSLILWSCAARSVPTDVAPPDVDAKNGTMVPEAAPVAKPEVRLPSGQPVVRECFAESRRERGSVGSRSGSGGKGGGGYGSGPGSSSSTRSKSPAPMTASAPPPLSHRSHSAAASGRQARRGRASSQVGGTRVGAPTKRKGIGARSALDRGGSSAGTPP